MLFRNICQISQLVDDIDSYAPLGVSGGAVKGVTKPLVVGDGALFFDAVFSFCLA